MAETKIPRVASVADKWTPTTELEHQMRCPFCERWFDMQSADEVPEHLHDEAKQKKPRRPEG